MVEQKRTELLPCPFCGETQMHIEHLDGVYLTHRCEGRSDRPVVKIVDQTEGRARSAWNRRTPIAAGGGEARDIYEVANQLFGYSDESTPDYLAEFLEREGREATKLADEIVRLRAALSTAGEPDLHAFAKEIIRDSWEGCDGGYIIQELALKHGIIKGEPFDPKVHGTSSECEPGDTWYTFAGPLASPPSETE